MLVTLFDLNPFRRSNCRPSNPFSPTHTPDAYFWFEVISGSLSTLLRKCKYPPLLEARFLGLFEQIAPQLGPAFPSTRKKLSADGTPIDLSWNYDGATSTMRFSFDLSSSPEILISELAAQ